MTGLRWIFLLAPVLIVACADEGTDVPAPARTDIASPGATPSPAKAASEAEKLTASCTYPLARGEEATKILRRYGADAKRATLGGPEGTELTGLVLWPGDPARRVEVILSEDRPERAIALRFGERSTWRVNGLRVGDSIETAVRVNSAGFSLYGFGWDYGGYVSDWKGGVLARQPGGCGVTVRFMPGENAELDEGLVGDRVIRSDAPGVAAAGASVSEITLDLGDGAEALATTPK